MIASRALRMAAWTLVALAAAGAVWLAWRPAAVPVEAVTVTRGPLRVTLDEQGETRAHDRFVVAAPVGGRLARIELHEGDAVRAGDVVATVYAAPLGAVERDALQARVANAEAQRREADEQLRKARALFEQARTDHARSERLVREGFVSGQAEEQARNAEEAARAEADAAAARVQAAKARVDAERALLVPDRPGGDRPIVLRAPASGRVLRVPEKSERVVASGTPVLVIGDPNALEVVVDLLSTEATRVRPGMAASIENWGGAPLRARVRLVEPYAFTKVSALGVEEQRVNVVLDLPDPPANLGDAYRVDVRILTAEAPDALKVPASAVFRSGTSVAVFAIGDGRVAQLAFDAGLRNRDEVEVSGGLREGMQVVRFPSSALRDGMRVRVQER